MTGLRGEPETGARRARRPRRWIAGKVLWGANGEHREIRAVIVVNKPTPD